MHKGRDFLKAQVSNAVMQHRTLVESLDDHAKQAEDPRTRELCARHLPHMQEHQRQLEEYRGTLGDVGGAGVKGALGAVLGKAKDVVDGFRGDDFLRLVEDEVMIRQSQDTMATFARVGEQLGEPRLSEIGRRAMTDHEQASGEFNDLIQRMFIENVQKDF